MRPIHQKCALVLAGALVAFGGYSFFTSNARSNSYSKVEDPGPSGQHLAVVEPGWSAFHMFLEPTDEVQTVALTLSNVSSSRIQIDGVTALESRNAEIDRVEIMGPQAPSLVYRGLEGRPPHHPDHEGQVIDLYRLDDFVMEPMSAVSVVSTTTLAGEEQGSPDGPADASILITYRRTERLGVSYLNGFRVAYHLVGSTEQTYVLDIPDVRVGTCVKGGETFGAECGE